MSFNREESNRQPVSAIESACRDCRTWPDEDWQKLADDYRLGRINSVGLRAVLCGDLEDYSDECAQCAHFIEEGID